MLRTSRVVYAWSGEDYLGSFRYSKKRKSPHRRWKARLFGMYPNVHFHKGFVLRH